MNSHLVVKENLENKLASSHREVECNDNKILIRFEGFKDTNYIKTLACVKPAVYYEWSKLLKEVGNVYKFSMRLSIDLFYFDYIMRILYIHDSERSILENYDYALDTQRKNEKK